MKKKIIIIITVALLCLTCSTSSSADYDNSVKTLYTYEIHTLSGVCDTITVDHKLMIYYKEGVSVVILSNDGIYVPDFLYMYVDRCKLINTEKIAKNY